MYFYLSAKKFPDCIDTFGNSSSKAVEFANDKHIAFN